MVVYLNADVNALFTTMNRQGSHETGKATWKTWLVMPDGVLKFQCRSLDGMIIA